MRGLRCASRGGSVNPIAPSDIGEEKSRRSGVKTIVWANLRVRSGVKDGNVSRNRQEDIQPDLIDHAQRI